MGYIFNLLKHLTPKSLISRFVLIICGPMIACQLISVYVFYDRHWNNVSAQTSKMLASQIELVAEEYSAGDLTKAVKYSRQFGFNIEISDKAPEEKLLLHRLELSVFDEVLKKNLKNYLSILQNHKRSKIRVFIGLESGKILKITIPTKPLFNPTSEVFVLWIISISIVSLSVALLFAKNQIRSIEELSDAANKFGKGASDRLDFKPTGATEIRLAGVALMKMQERIEKQVQKRMQMLAMISHDLRTPLTRMLLQLELLDETHENNMLKSDVESMKHMIDSFLDFARGEEGEKPEIVNVNSWLQDFFKFSRFKTTKLLVSNDDIKAQIKPLSFMRALTNIISNAEKYSTYSEFSCHVTDNHIVFTLEDNGPGIKEEEKHLVFKAFFRSDKARRIDANGSVGLGLPIAKEIILSHKGAIIILDSKKLGGAKIVVTIPRVG